MTKLRKQTLRLLTTTLLLAATASAGAQVIGQNKSSDGNGTYTITVTRNLVVETVVVKDKQGNPIDNLTARDFVLTEDGVPQTISFVEHQVLPAQPITAPIVPPSQENIKIYNKLSREQIAPESPGSVRYKDRRLLAFYFDMVAMPNPADQMRALAAAEKFIRTQITTADMVAIMRYSGGSVDVLQDFTDDRSRLLSILETMTVGEGQGFDESVSDAGAADTGAAFGQDDSEFNLFNNDRELAALQTASHMLASLNEKKSLIYFAAGLRLNGIDNQAQLHATEDEAIRAGVAFWPIDARGLVAGAPLGDATQGSPGNIGMYSGTAAMANTSRFQQSQDTLYALASDTGGKALFDNNDLTRGIVNAEKDVTSYYILGYYTTNTTLDGRFRRIKITLNPTQDAKLDFRQGYYAGKVFGKFTAAEKERQLEDALMLGDPLTELTIAMELNYFQINHAEYFVPITVKIPGSELALAKKGGAQHTLIDFVLEVKDDYGNSTMTNLRDHVDIKLSDTTAAELARRPLEYDTGISPLPGKYTVKLLARDDETGRIGTFQTSFVIPNLDKEARRVAISSVVLGSQHVDMKEALYNAGKAKDQAKQDAANPLIENGQKLVPSVTRVFSKSRNLFIYLQAYQHAAITPAPLISFVTFYRNHEKVMETQPMETRTAMPNSLKTMSFSFNIPLAQLTPGDYDCQVTVLDPTSGKSTFWQSQITVIP